MIRKIKLFIASSLDGFIARPDGGIDWLLTDADYGMTEFFKSVDTGLMGRKTYDVSLTLGGVPSDGNKYYVFSRSPNNGKVENAEFVSGDVREFVDSLRSSPGKDIWLMGGGELTQTFLNERLIDEVILTILPVILGSGVPLFREPNRQTDLSLERCETYKNGLIQVFYRVNQPNEDRKE